MSSLSRSRSPKGRGRYGSPKGRSGRRGAPKGRRDRSPRGGRDRSPKGSRPSSNRRSKIGKRKGLRSRSLTPEEKRRSVTPKGKRRSPSSRRSPKHEGRSSRRKHKNRSPSRSSSEGDRSKRKKKSRHRREKRYSRGRRKKSKRRRRSASSSSSSSFSSDSESDGLRRRRRRTRRHRHRRFEDSSSSDTCSSSSSICFLRRRRRRRGKSEYRRKRGRRSGRRGRSEYRDRNWDWDPQAGDIGYFCDPQDVAVVFPGKILKVIDGGRNLIVDHHGKDQTIVKTENFTMDERYDVRNEKYDAPRRHKQDNVVRHKPDYVVETDCESAATVVNIRVQRMASKSVEKKEAQEIRNGQYEHSNYVVRDSQVRTAQAKERVYQEREMRIPKESYLTQQHETIRVEDESKEADITDHQKGAMSGSVVNSGGLPRSAYGIFTSELCWFRESSPRVKSPDRANGKLKVNELNIMLMPCPQHACQQHNPYSYGPMTNGRY